MPAIKVSDLQVHYHKIEHRSSILGRTVDLVAPKKTRVMALEGVSFQIEPGEIVGYVGANGAGKTTTTKVLSGILAPTNGRVEVLGHTPIERNPSYLREIGLVLGAKSQLYWDLPALDYFQFLRQVYRLDSQSFANDLNYLCEVFSVGSLVRTPVRLLSQGERAKMELICALIHRPKVLFLDEPTYGLDIWSQSSVRQVISRVNRDLGVTVLITSHNLEDLDILCERLMVLNHGRIIFDGERHRLKDRFLDVRCVKASGLASRDWWARLDLGEDSIVDEGPAYLSFVIPKHRLPDLPMTQEGVTISINEVPLDYIIKRLVRS